MATVQLLRQARNKERDNDRQFPLAILNGTWCNTESHHTSQNHKNCQTKVMDGKHLVICSRALKETETLLVSVSRTLPMMGFDKVLLPDCCTRHIPFESS
jgi:hypothetical protein